MNLVVEIIYISFKTALCLLLKRIKMCFCFKKKIFKSLFFFLNFSLTNIWGGKKSFFFSFAFFLFLGKTKEEKTTKMLKKYLVFPLFLHSIFISSFFSKAKKKIRGF